MNRGNYPMFPGKVAVKKRHPSPQTQDKRQNKNITPIHNATVQNRTPTGTTQPTTGAHKPLPHSISPRSPPLNTTPTYPPYSRNVQTHLMPTNKTQHIRNRLMPTTTRPNFLH